MAVQIIGSETEFQNLALKADKPVLVDFWAPWCSPCRMVAPEVEAVAQNFAGRALVVKVDVDEQAAVAAKYGVMSIPTLLVLKNGVEVSRFTGFRPRKDLEAALEEALS